MAISVTCAECDTGFRLPDAMAGKTVTPRSVAHRSRWWPDIATSVRCRQGRPPEKRERSERGSTIRLRKAGKQLNHQGECLAVIALDQALEEPVCLLTNDCEIVRRGACRQQIGNRVAEGGGESRHKVDPRRAAAGLQFEM